MTTDERTEIMRRLRPLVSDSDLARAFRVSRQYVGQALGPRAEEPAESAKTLPQRDTDASARLPAALLAWRKHYGLTQAQAAGELGLSSAAQYNRWERGRSGSGLASLVLKYLDLYRKTY